MLEFMMTVVFADHSLARPDIAGHVEDGLASLQHVRDAGVPQDMGCDFTIDTGKVNRTVSSGGR